MMKIDTKNPYAKKPKKIDNELGIYNADYENFIHFAEQTIGECEHIDEYKDICPCDDCECKDRANDVSYENEIKYD